jgi:transaldolase
MIRGDKDSRDSFAGAHIITIPPQFLARMADHKYTRATVGQFVSDARKALEMMEKTRKHKG